MNNAATLHIPALRSSSAGRVGWRTWLAALLLAVWLHYLLTPAEGGGFALYLRFGLALLGSAMLLGTAWQRPLLQGLALPLCGLALWIVLMNLMSTTWWGVMFAGFAVMACLISAAFYVPGWRASLVLALDLLLAAWVGLFLAQYAVYYLNGSLVDVHHMLHPWSQARLGFEGDASLLRLTGPHIEPGTYANWVYGLVVLRALVRGKWFDWPDLLAVATTLLSFSLWSVLAGAVFFAAAVLACLWPLRPLRLALLLLLLLPPAIWLWLNLDKGGGDGLQYLMGRLDAGDGSGASKLQAYQGFMRELGHVLLLGTSLDHDFCRGCESPQDAGLALNLMMRLGLPVALFIVFSTLRAAWKSGGLPAVLALLPLWVGKFYVFDPLFWLIAGVGALSLTKHRAAPPRPGRR